jgi:hypothetical protein
VHKQQQVCRLAVLGKGRFVCFVVLDQYGDALKLVLIITNAITRRQFTSDKTSSIIILIDHGVVVLGSDDNLQQYKFTTNTVEPASLL